MWHPCQLSLKLIKIKIDILKKTCIIHTVEAYTHIEKYPCLTTLNQCFLCFIMRDQITSRSLTWCLGTHLHAEADSVAEPIRGRTLLPSWFLSYFNLVISSTFSSSGEQRWREESWIAAVISQHFYANPVNASPDYTKCICKNSPSQSNHTGSCQGHNCG